LPQDFYSSISYTDKMLGYLKDHAGDGKPFFAYLAYTAPHWPLQAPDADIARQRGRYDEGYEVLRQKRFKDFIAKGFGAKSDTTLPNLPPGYRPWSSLTAEEQARSARSMEIYAAMIERMDSEAGRLLKYLEDSGQMRNTIVIFQSDNGAEGIDFPNNDPVRDNSLDNIGRPNSWVSLGTGWATAAEAPYHLLKYYTGEGGIHVPAFVSGSALGIPKGHREGSLIMTYDVAPTILELAGVSTASPKDRPDALSITGRSFADVLRGQANATRRGANDAVGWEHNGHAAIRKGDWKLLRVGIAASVLMGAGAGPAGRPGPGGTGPGSGREAATPNFGAGSPPPVMPPRSRAVIAAGQPAGDPVGGGGPWKLYNLREDPRELHDQSKQHPEIVADLMKEWQRYAAENGVIVKSGQPAQAAGIP
jgi:arylsulfatase